MGVATPYDFDGTDRFEIVRCLGEGGMGAVYEVVDRESDARMALKLLRRIDDDAVLRFKKEFRRLQDIQHPNLVSLGELVASEGNWFFTMELIDGVTFLEWVRGGDMNSDVDYDRLRDAMAQLARGLRAIHQAGKVHRDVKPSNILVDHSGRVVLLDFGLATDLSDPQRSELRVVGTVDYMAPEQAASRPAGIEADWYSAGVLLYEALTKTVPFEGPPIEVMMRKQRLTPPPPRTVVAGIPPELDSLCADLLHFDPLKRATGADVLRRLGVEAKQPELASTTISTLPFVGRRRELAQLRAAFGGTARGNPITVLVEGESGVGKTALVRRFGSSIRKDLGNALVLSGRCYERESVSYKAFEGIVDDLARHMNELPRPELAMLLPKHAWLLAQVFPTLRRVEPIATAASLGDVADPHELRRRVFGALRELFTRLAEHRAVVLAIDDLQWADADSLALLVELLRPPGAPAIMVLATRRHIEEERPIHLPGRVDRIELVGLPERDAEELVRRLLRRSRVEGDARAIAAEAAGHPLFLGELVWHLARDDTPGGARRLEDVIANRIARLEPEVQRLLQVLAVAGGPIAQEVAARASDIDFADLTRYAGELRAAHLARTTGGRSGDLIETYHDRVRTAVALGLGRDDIVVLHRRLAEAFEVAEELDPEGLCTHWRGAGDDHRAAQYASMAAARAAESLAFERAARLYRLSLELAADDSDLARRIHRHLGDALANAGRGPEAAEIYLRAAAHANDQSALALRRRAAEQFLLSGHVDRGLEEIRSVLSAVGLGYPSSPRSALASLLARRAQLRLRGLRYKETADKDVPVEVLDRIDVCWAVSKALGMVDTIRGADFQTRHLLLALSAGEPFRVARALAGECAFSAMGGGRTRKRSKKLLKATREVATLVEDPYALALVKLARGLVTNLSGRWVESYDLTRRAEQLFREQCTGVAWEVDTAQFFTLFSLMYMGELRELGRMLPSRLDDAVSRGDLYAASSLRSRFGAVVALAADDPERPRDDVREMISRWSQRGYHLQHWWDLVVSCDIDLYANEGHAAWLRLQGDWPPLQQSMLLRVQQIQIEAHYLRGRCALSRAVFDQSVRPAMISRALRDARTIEREKMAWGDPLALLLRAGAANLEGNVEDALVHLQEAARTLADAVMPLHAAAAQRCIGILLGGARGEEIQREADHWMTTQGIKNPRRYTRMLVPGLPGTMA